MTRPIDNVQDQERARQMDGAERRERETDVRNVLGTPSGRRVLHRLIAGLKGHGAPLWCASAELHFRVGRYDAGVELEAEMRRLAPTEFSQMEAEALEADARTSAHRAHRTGGNKEQTDA